MDATETERNATSLARAMRYDMNAYVFSSKALNLRILVLISHRRCLLYLEACTSYFYVAPVGCLSRGQEALRATFILVGTNGRVKTRIDFRLLLLRFKISLLNGKPYVYITKYVVACLPFASPTFHLHPPRT